MAVRLDRGHGEVALPVGGEDLRELVHRRHQLRVGGPLVAAGRRDEGVLGVGVGDEPVDGAGRPAGAGQGREPAPEEQGGDEGDDEDLGLAATEGGEDDGDHQDAAGASWTRRALPRFVPIALTSSSNAIPTTLGKGASTERAGGASHTLGCAGEAMGSVSPSRRQLTPYPEPIASGSPDRSGLPRLVGQQMVRLRTASLSAAVPPRTIT